MKLLLLSIAQLMVLQVLFSVAAAGSLSLLEGSWRCCRRAATSSRGGLFRGRSSSLIGVHVTGDGPLFLETIFPNVDPHQMRIKELRQKLAERWSEMRALSDRIYPGQIELSVAGTAGQVSELNHRLAGASRKRNDPSNGSNTLANSFPVSTILRARGALLDMAQAHAERTGLELEAEVTAAWSQPVLPLHMTVHEVPPGLAARCGSSGNPSFRRAFQLIAAEMATANMSLPLNAAILGLEPNGADAMVQLRVLQAMGACATIVADSLEIDVQDVVRKHEGDRRLYDSRDVYEVAHDNAIRNAYRACWNAGAGNLRCGEEVEWCDSSGRFRCEEVVQPASERRALHPVWWVYVS